MANEEQNEPIPPDVLLISSRSDGKRAVVELVGELDFHGSGRFSATVEQVLSDAVERLEIDATRLIFADSAGLRAMLLARDEAQTRGTVFEVTGVTEPVERVIELAGLSELLLTPQKETKG